MLKKISLLLCAFALTIMPLQAKTKAHHVVFVVTSGDRADWETAMILADHFLAGIKPEAAEVEVLAYGPGISIMAKGAPTAPQLADLLKLRVHFVACENAMRAHSLTKADLLPGVTSVPSGVIELVRRQEAGWAYVKVGK